MDSVQTIKSLLNADFTQLSASSMRDFESTDNIQQLRHSLQENVPDHQWTIIRQQVLTQIEQLLDIPLHPILVKAWSTHDAVKREIEQQQANRTNHEESIVVLDSHEIRSTHSPTLTTKVGKDNTINLRFFIGVVLQLKHISLKIQQGEIKAVLAGVMSGNGFMQHQNITLIEADFFHIKLAGGISNSATVSSNAISRIKDEKNEVVTAIANNVASNMASNKTASHIALSTTDITPERLHDADSTAETPDDTGEITTENRYKQQLPSAFKRNITQFILGVMLAVIALFIFWQMMGI